MSASWLSAVATDYLVHRLEEYITAKVVFDSPSELSAYQDASSILHELAERARSAAVLSNPQEAGGQ